LYLILGYSSARDGGQLNFLKSKSFNMSDSLFSCPAPATLSAIPQQNCAVRWDQVVKLLFQRKQATSSFDATTIKDEANWTPLLTANDSTKVVISPYLNNVVVPPGEAITAGGNDNTTIGGVRQLKGKGFQACSFELRNADAAVRAAVDKLTSESALVPGFTNLWVYPVNQFGQIICKSDGSGIPIYNFFVGGPGSEGYLSDNVQIGSFDLKGGWDKDVTVITPDFDILGLTGPDAELGEVGPLAFSAVASTTLTLGWNADSDAETYKVQRSLSSSFTSVTESTVTAPTVSLSVTGLVAGTKYYFRVKAVAAGFADGPWAVAAVTTDV
jgi:hypothetical protein